MNIYVSNLGFNVQDAELKQLFSSYGEVSSAKVIMDKFSNQSRGFGFVAAGQKAIDELNGTSTGGRPIKVTEARPREDKPRTNRW
jgi:RNA recognition motif-containing protein